MSTSVFATLKKTTLEIVVLPRERRIDRVANSKPMKHGAKVKKHGKNMAFLKFSKTWQNYGIFIKNRAKIWHNFIKNRFLCK